MPFNPPGIIGGGSIISPAIQNDPFKGINDAITRARDRKLKDKALQLEAFNIYADLEKNASADGTEFPDFKTWYAEFNQNPNESQASAGGFFNMIGDVAGAGLEGIGRIGKGLFEQGQQSAVNEIQAVHNNSLQNGDSFDPGNPSNDPMKVQRQTENENQGKFKKFLSDFGRNAKTNMSEFSEGVVKPFFKDLDYKGKYLGKPKSSFETGEHYNFMNVNDIKSFQSDYMNMVEGDKGFGNLDHTTRKKRKELGFERGGSISGNRTGDKNKAYLEDGEYVLNRNAVEGMGKGFLDYINNERYPRFQSGGRFDAPEIIHGQVVRPEPPSQTLSSGLDVSGGGGGESGDKAAMAMKLFGMQRGGYVPGYQTGGYMSQQRANYLQNKRNEDAMGDFRRARDRYDVGVNQQQIEMDKYQEDLSSGWSGAGLWTADLMTPDFATGPLLSWMTGTDVEDIEDYPRAMADKRKADFSRDYMREEMEAPFGEGVRPTAAMLAEKKAYAGTPTASTATRLSNDALEKKVREAQGNYNAVDLLEKLYGPNWANSMMTNPMGN